MSYESTDWAEMFNQTISVKTRSGHNTDGSPTFSTASVSYPALVMNVNHQVRNPDGTVQMAAYVAYVGSTGVLSPNSRYQLPDGATPPVLLLDAYPDENGATHHNKITFGSR